MGLTHPSISSIFYIPPPRDDPPTMGAAMRSDTFGKLLKKLLSEPEALPLAVAVGAGVAMAGTVIMHNLDWNPDVYVNKTRRMLGPEEDVDAKDSAYLAYL